MSWEIVLHPEVEAWYLKLEDPVTAELVTRAVDMLASSGPALRRPLVGEIVSS